jgi:hypothetical protein
VARDELLRLTGSTNNALETVGASAAGTGIYVGANRLIEVEARVAGPVTGAGATLDVAVQEATTVGGSYTTIGSFPQLAAADIPAEAGGDRPKRIAVLTSKPYVRINKTVGGTSPSFGSFQAHVVPPQGGVAVG